jgi:hypothetical protein
MSVLINSLEIELAKKEKLALELLTKAIDAGLTKEEQEALDSFTDYLNKQ